MAIGLEYYFQRGTPAKDGAPCADPQFRTLQVCLNDVPATLWQAEHAVNRLHGSGTPGREGRAMSNISSVAAGGVCAAAAGDAGNLVSSTAQRSLKSTCRRFNRA
jgi:hypothetical protein